MPIIPLDPKSTPREVRVETFDGLICITHYIEGIAELPIKLNAAQTDTLITALQEARKKLS